MRNSKNIEEFLLKATWKLITRAWADPQTISDSALCGLTVSIVSAQEGSAQTCRATCLAKSSLAAVETGSK